MTEFKLDSFYKHLHGKDVVFQPLSITYTRDGYAMTVLWYRIAHKGMLVPLQYDTITVDADDVSNWDKFVLTNKRS